MYDIVLYAFGPGVDMRSIIIYDETDKTDRIERTICARNGHDTAITQLPNYTYIILCYNSYTAVNVLNRKRNLHLFITRLYYTWTNGVFLKRIQNTFDFKE